MVAGMTLRSFPKTAWNDRTYAFVTPPGIIDQMRLSPSELAFYTKEEWLPPAKRTDSSMSPEQVVQVRLANESQPLPTLCASYASQHKLDACHLASKGVFAVLEKKGKEIFFLDPALWTSLLGATETVVLPAKLTLTFKILGNAISTPQSLLALLLAFQSVFQRPVSIADTIKQCWDERLQASNTIVLAGLDFWTLMPMQEYMNSIKAHPPSKAHTGTLINVKIEFRRHHGTQQQQIPAMWSLKRFLLETLHIDHNATRSITCGNIDRRASSHDTLHHLASLNNKWDISLKSIEFIRLTFQGSYTLTTTKATHKRPIPNQTLVLDVPTLDEVFELSTFHRFLAVMEDFYYNTSITTPDDGKQMIHIGIPPPGFVTRVPVRKGQQSSNLNRSELWQISFFLTSHRETSRQHQWLLPQSRTTQYTCCHRQMTRQRTRSRSSWKRCDANRTFTQQTCR